MSEKPELNEPAKAEPAPAAMPEPDAAREAAGMPRRRGPAEVLPLVGLVLLGCGFTWVVVRQDAEESQLLRLEERITAVERRPGAATVDLLPLERRLAVLEARPAAVVNLQPLEGRIAALERRPDGAPVDLGPLDARLAALEQRPAPAPQVLPDPRVDALAARLTQLGGALMHLASEEAALRLAYPEAARAAAAASRVEAKGQPVWQRMWQEMSSLVTVRDGARVLSGPPAAPALELAQSRVDAGDIAGAVQALDGLDPPAAAAMAPWRARAAAWLTARAALTKAGG